jgi:TP901 family phage tail tape measure protein
MASNKYAVETAFHLIDKATEPLNKIGVKGNAVGKALKKDFMKAQDQLASLGKAAGKAALAIGAAGVTAAGAFAVKGVKDAIEYQTALAKVKTIADTTKVPLNQLANDILNLSTKMGIGATGLSESVYQAISAGVATEKAVSMVEIASKAAIGGFTDTTTAIDGLTSVLNAYGLETERAVNIADQMLIAQNLGKTSFGDMAKTMGAVIPTAAALNVSTEELFSSVAALTANAIQTPQAMTGLKAALSNIQKPSSQAAELAKKLGINFSAAALQSKGFAGFLQDIAKATKGDQAILAQFFGSTEALNAVNVLIGSGADLFERSIEEMKNSTGTLETAFNTMMDTPEKRFEKILNTVKNAGIKLGTALLPIVEKVTEKIEVFVDELGTIDFQPIADKVGVVFEKIFQAAEFFVWLAGVIWKLRFPILAIVAVVALYRGGMLVAAAAVNAFTAAQNILKGVQLAGYLITGNQTKAMALYKAGTMGATVQTTLFWAKQKAAQGLNFAGTILKQGAAFVTQKAQLIASTAAIIAHAAAQKAAAVATGLMNGAMGIANSLFVASPIGWIVLAIGALIAIIILCVKNWDKITAALKIAWEWIKNVAGIVKDGLCNAFKSLTGFVSENSEKVLALIAIFTGPFGFIISIIKELKDNWGAIVEAFKTDGIIAGFKKLGGVILSAVLAPIQGLLEILAKIPGVRKLLGPAVEKIQEFRNNLAFV